MFIYIYICNIHISHTPNFYRNIEPLMVVTEVILSFPSDALNRMPLHQHQCYCFHASKK